MAVIRIVTSLLLLALFAAPARAGVGTETNLEILRDTKKDLPDYFHPVTH